MFSGYLDRRAYILRMGVALLLLLLWPYAMPYIWTAIRGSIAQDARGAVQIIFIVLVKAGITLGVALYALPVVARRLRYLGASPLFALAICGLLLADTAKYLTMGFQAYLMPSFLQASFGPFAIGMMIALALFPDRDAPRSSMLRDAGPVPVPAQGGFGTRVRAP